MGVGGEIACALKGSLLMFLVIVIIHFLMKNVLESRDNNKSAKQPIVVEPFPMDDEDEESITAQGGGSTVDSNTTDKLNQNPDYDLMQYVFGGSGPGSPLPPGSGGGTGSPLPPRSGGGTGSPLPPRAGGGTGSPLPPGAEPTEEIVAFNSYENLHGASPLG